MSRSADISPGWTRYWEALETGQPAGAVEVALSLLDSGFDPLEVLDQLVTPAQIEVGRRWAANEWNVAQEHRATSVSEEVVAALGARIATPGGAGRVVVSCVDGDWHSLPSRVVSTALRHAGWRVDHLGASVPVDHLAQFIQDTGPDAVALSCSLPTNLRRGRLMIESARQAGAPVIVGGPGFGPAGRWGLELGANATAADASGAVAVLGGPDWPAFTDAAPPYDPPDGSDRAVVASRADIVASADTRLAAMWPGVLSYTEFQKQRTEEDLGHLTDFLGAALYVDDSDLYRDFVTWMAAILVSRGVPVPALRAGLHAVDAALGEVLGPDAGRARRFVALAVEAVAAT